MNEKPSSGVSLLEIKIAISPRLPELFGRLCDLFRQAVDVSIVKPAAREPTPRKPASVQSVAVAEPAKPRPTAAKLIWDAIDANGPEFGATKSQLSRQVRSVGKAQRDAAIESLLAEEKIESFVIRGHGKPATKYFVR